MLYYTPQVEIDLHKWDALVNASRNSNVFCNSWYLDAFCKWDAIILDDYSGAIALPTRSKFGFKQVYQPNFIQKCIWFGTFLKSEDEITLKKLLLNHYSLIQINTNIRLEPITQRTNLIIPLSRDVFSIRNDYSRSLKRNLKRKEDKLIVTKTKDATQIIELYKRQWGALNPQLKNEDYETLNKLINQRPQNFDCVEVSSQGTLLAGKILLKGKNRFHYIMGSSAKLGKKENALSFAIDHTIALNAESKMIFDFEGSSIPSVKSFYETFGSIDEPFYEMTLSSGIAKVLKKIYNRFKKS